MSPIIDMRGLFEVEALVKSFTTKDTEGHRGSAGAHLKMDADRGPFTK